MHGFDFAYQGLLGIWEGLDAAPQQDNSSSADGKDQLGASDATSLVSVDLALNPDGAPSTRTKHNSRRSHSPADMFHGNYHAALNSLNSRRDLDRSVWKPTVSTTKLAHRRLALALCDWKVGEEEFKRYVCCILCLCLSHHTFQVGKGRQSISGCVLASVHQPAIESYRRANAE